MESLDNRHTDSILDCSDCYWLWLCKSFAFFKSFISFFLTIFLMVFSSLNARNLAIAADEQIQVNKPNENENRLFNPILKIGTKKGQFFSSFYFFLIYYNSFKCRATFLIQILSVFQYFSCSTSIHFIAQNGRISISVPNS